jgi:iron complex transport system ATP-binding protein
MSELAFDAVRVVRGKKTLLDAVSFRVERGEVCALLGPNGAGKSTLLGTALGLVKPTSGEVRFGGRALSALSPRERAGALAWLPQEPLGSDAIPAIESVIAARYRFAESSHAARTAALRALDRVGVAAFADAPLSNLSGGERQRVAFAGLLAQEAEWLLLDEPANHLDPAQQAEIYALLGTLAREGAGILCVTHDVNLLAHGGGAARVIGLKRGGLRFDTPYADAALPERLGELFGVPMRALDAGDARLILPLVRPRGAEA